MEGKTFIVIAHRLSTITDSDKMVPTQLDTSGSYSTLLRTLDLSVDTVNEILKPRSWTLAVMRLPRQSGHPRAKCDLRLREADCALGCQLFHPSRQYHRGCRPFWVAGKPPSASDVQVMEAGGLYRKFVEMRERSIGWKLGGKAG